MFAVRALGLCLVLGACSGTEPAAGNAGEAGVDEDAAETSADGGNRGETDSDGDAGDADDADGAPDADGDAGEEAINAFGALNFTLEAKPVSEQISLLASNGYRHVSFWWRPPTYNPFAEFVADDRVAKGALPVLAVLFEVNIEEPHDVSRTSAAVAALADHQTILWLLLPGRGSDSDLVRVAREVADLARDAGVRVVLYPHQGNLMADAEDALRIQRLTERPNVGISLHLCHEFKAGNRDRLTEVIQNVAAEVDIATINGADSAGDAQSAGWSRTIMPLDTGDFDVENAYLVPLWRAGYRGPLVLHTFDILDPPEEHLRRSAERFRSMAERLK